MLMTIACLYLSWSFLLTYKALKGAAEEYALILDTTTRYAVYRTGTAFSCKRQVGERLQILLPFCRRLPDPPKL